MYKFLTSQTLWQILAACAVIGLILNIVAKKRRTRKGEEYYMDYAGILRSAFKQDRRSRNAILEALAYLRGGNVKQAEKIFNHLMVEAHETDDFIALRALLALCFLAEGNESKAEQYLRRIAEDSADKQELYNVLVRIDDFRPHTTLVDRAFNDLLP